MCESLYQKTFDVRQYTASRIITTLNVSLVYVTRSVRYCCFNCLYLTTFGKQLITMSIMLNLCSIV